MRPFLLLVTVLLVVAPAYGELYEWVDDSGSVNFSDNPEHIPAKYRGRATMRESTSDDKAEKVERAKETPLQAEPAPRPAPELYGGRPLSWWKDTYAAKSNRLKALQARLAKLKDEEVEARRKRLTLQRTRDRMALVAKTKEHDETEAKVTEMEKELAEFTSLAESSGLSIDMLGGSSR